MELYFAGELPINDKFKKTLTDIYINRLMSYEYQQKGVNEMLLYMAGDYQFNPHSTIDIFDISSYNRLLSHGDYQYAYTSKYVNGDLKNTRSEKLLALFMAGADKFGRKELERYMKLYFAGVSETDKPPIDCNALFSYEFEQKQHAFDKLKGFIKSGKLFIDSGAFSAWTKGSKIDVKKYIKWLNDRADDIDLCGQVDVIPGDRIYGANPTQVREAAKKSWNNYLFMRCRLKNPDSLLYTYHVGEPIEFLEQALEWRDENGNPIPYMAFGGMVGKSHDIRDKFLEKCFITIRKSSNPNIKIHTFGMTDFELLEKYPIHSADSTSWIMVGAMGNVMTDYGNIAVSYNQKSDPKHYSHLPQKAIDDFNELIKEFGFTLDDLAEHRDNRILFNAMYMNKKVTELNSKERKFNYRKKLF